MKRFVAAVAILALSCGAVSAQLINGGFETGDMTGWTSLSGSGSVVSGNYFGMAPAQGTYYWALVRSYGSSPGDEGIAQQVTLGPGTYTVSAAAQAYANNQFVYSAGAPTIDTSCYDSIRIDTNGGVDPNAADVMGPNVATSAGWQTISQNFTLASTKTVTIFLYVKQTYAEAGSWNGWDNVTLVPEPSSMLAMAGGLVGFVGLIRRKRA